MSRHTFFLLLLLEEEENIQSIKNTIFFTITFGNKLYICVFMITA